MRLGLIGYPVAHSWSPRLFARFSERDGIPLQYGLFPMPDASVLRSWLHENPDIRGLNVTIPHKRAVLGLCDALDSSALAVGAVNTLVIRRGGAGKDTGNGAGGGAGGGAGKGAGNGAGLLHLTSYNTDVVGFISSLPPHFGPDLGDAWGSSVPGHAALPGLGDATLSGLGHREESSGLGHTEESSGLGDAGGLFGLGNAGRLPVSQKLVEHPGRPRRALVVGTGGSARAVACALQWLNIPFDLVGRNLPLPLETALPGSTTAGCGETTPSYDVLFAAAHLYTYPQLSERSLAAYDLIVHCTPLGMDPGFAHQRVPLDLRSCAPGALLYDLVYTPSVTPLMQEALDCGLRVCGGLAMLEQQAEAAWRLWKG